MQVSFFVDGLYSMEHLYLRLTELTKISKDAMGVNSRLQVFLITDKLGPVSHNNLTLELHHNGVEIIKLRAILHKVVHFTNMRES